MNLKQEQPKGLKLVNLMAFAVILIYLPYFLQALDMLGQGLNMSDIKANATLGNFHVSPLIDILYTYVARPFRFIIIPITIINVCIDKKKNNILIILTILIVLFDFITSGSKFAILYIIAQLITIILFLGRRNFVVNRNIKRIIKFTTIILGIFILYRLTIKNNNIFENLYVYISGCMPFLSIKLDSFISDHSSITYGMTSFQGVIRPIIAFLNSTGLIEDIPNLFQLSESITTRIEYKAYIGDSIPYNAFVSPFYYFYVDGKLIGVISLSLLFGVFCERAYIKFVNNTSRSAIVLYLLIIQLLVTCMVRFQFSNIIFALTFLYYWVFIKKLRLYK